MNDYIKGLIYGLVIGDTLGLSTEFLSKEQVRQIYTDKITYYNFFRDEHRSLWKNGEYTDDSELSLLLFHHLLFSENNKINEILLAKEIKYWYTEIARGIGTNISRVINHKSFLASPKLASLSVSLNINSNGAVMRTALLSLFPNVIENVISACKMTNFSEDCIISCLFVTLLIQEIIQRNSKLNRRTKLNSKQIEKSIMNTVLKIEKLKYDTEILLKYLNIKTLSELNLNIHIGYTYKPLGCAIYALRHQKATFYHTIEPIIREGGDADTNACIVGAFLGALNGYDYINEELKTELSNKNYIDDLYFLYINKMSYKSTYGYSKRNKVNYGYTSDKKLSIPEIEVYSHFKYIINQKEADLVYKYTVNSYDLRRDQKEIKKLNNLIINAPLLHKKYTVYNVSSPNNEITIYDNDLQVKNNIYTIDLQIGDLFSQNIEYINQGSGILSATFDKSYPLNTFSSDFVLRESEEELLNTINNLSFSDIKKYGKRNQKINYSYELIVNEILKPNIDTFIEYYDFEDASELYNEITIENVLDASSIYLKKFKQLVYDLRNTLKDIYFTEICCCCLFKIKLTNQVGLLIEEISLYPDQHEIILPNNTICKVNNITRENYGVAINPFNYYNETEIFKIKDKEYIRYKPLIEDIDFLIKTVNVYHIETIKL